MKLSKAQQRVMDYAKTSIDKARSFADFETYFDEVHAKHFNGMYNSAEKLKARDRKSFEWWRKLWEAEKDAIVLTGNVNSRTLYKLQELGLIEIIDDGKNRSSGIDRIKVINY